MKKVAINSCYGGFELSSLATALLYEAKHSSNYYIYMEKLDSALPFFLRKYVLIKSKEELENKCNDLLFLEKNNGDEIIISMLDEHVILSKNFEKNYGKCSKDEIKQLIEKSASIQGNADSMTCFDVDRDDPDLISIIEQIGEETASGIYSHICLVEVDDSREFYVQNHDGIEHVEYCS